jgi:hypothetical protein
MAFTSTTETIYYIECDGCRQRAPFGFKPGMAIYKARAAGFQEHGQVDKDKIWSCPTCQQEIPPVRAEKAPLKAVPTRS